MIMSSALLGAIISAVASTAGNIALAEHQRKVNESYVDKQNAYNLPSEQVERLKAAGINPQGMANGSIIGANSSAQYSSYQAPLIEDVMSHASNSALSIENAKDIRSTREARINLATQQAEQAKQNALNLGASTAAQLELNKWIGLQQSYAARESQSRIDVAKWQAKEIQQSIDVIRQKLPFELGELQSKIDLNNLSLDHILAQISDLKASVKLKSEQSETEQAHQEQLNVETGLKQQESDYYSKVTDKVIQLYSNQIREVQARTGLTEEQTYWKAFEVIAASQGSVVKNFTGLGSGLDITRHWNDRRKRYMTGSNF